MKRRCCKTRKHFLPPLRFLLQSNVSSKNRRFSGCLKLSNLSMLHRKRRESARQLSEQSHAGAFRPTGQTVKGTDVTGLGIIVINWQKVIRRIGDQVSFAFSFLLHCVVGFYQVSGSPKSRQDYDKLSIPQLRDKKQSAWKG